MLRAFENTIVKELAAVRIDLRQARLGARFGHGTRYRRLRTLIPRQTLQLPEQTEVIWVVLMGPENYPLDLFEGWRKPGVRSVLYLFDTMPLHLPSIRRLTADHVWDLCITSFNDAVPMLEEATGRKWYHVSQAVPLSLFAPVEDSAERAIHFSAYGRRHPKVHEATLRFCEQQGLYYDFTTHGRDQPTAESLQLYKQYAWHLGHSVFSFCWPVELTNPARAAGLSPITCRWFEAAAAGTVVLGEKPKNPLFDELFGNDFVTVVNPELSVEAVVAQLGAIWAKKSELLKCAEERRRSLVATMDWSARVAEIMSLLQSIEQSGRTA